MNSEQFLKAVTIISDGGLSQFETKNDCGPFGNPSEGKLSINLIGCSCNVIKSLLKAGYTCTLRDGKLSVDCHS